MSWECPTCKRKFSRVNQRHRCGTGNRDEVIRNRPDFVVNIFNALEAFIQSLGDIEVVARDRYVLFRSSRVFTDVNIMASAVRIAIHLDRKIEDPIFIKVVSDKKTHTHVAKLTTVEELDRVKSLVKEAYEFSMEGKK